MILNFGKLNSGGTARDGFLPDQEKYSPRYPIRKKENSNIQEMFNLKFGITGLNEGVKTILS